MLRRITRVISDLEVLVVRLALLGSLVAFAYRFVVSHW
jgi:hypothetical protein